ncbi:MAG: glycosyltransferase family 2 protein [Planctomycetota bacterium]|nr:glycosyltransferase family 2 protein [Planctomycetota bacterium]
MAPVTTQASSGDARAQAPVLSIVVVNWNTRDLLLALLARLLPAPIACEVVVVDNLSSDDSVEQARRQFPDAIVLPQPRNGGFAYGVNRGLERARGPWILLLNTDAQATWADLLAFVAAAEQQPDAAVFGPRIVDERGATQASTWPSHLPRHYLPQALFLDRLVPRATQAGPADVDCVSGCVFLIRAAALADVGGFDERFFMYFEEADFCARVRRAGWRVRWLPGTSFVHVGGLSAEQAAEKTFLAFRESCLLYHAAWHGRLLTEWVRLCLLLGIGLRLAGWCAAALLGRRHRCRLYWHAALRLLRPGCVGELCGRARVVPRFGAARATGDTTALLDSHHLSR